MKNLSGLIAVLLFIGISGCSPKHLISDENYRKTVDSSFAATVNMLEGDKPTLSNIFSGDLTAVQREAMEFMYAFMPLNDIADYSFDFFRANTDIALKNRKERPWGKTVPDNIFLHYVLPVRVNNENLDSFRLRYYDEIISKIRNKNIEDAALEINHWCHEKVSYQASDSRTSAPMSTILSARGRCGEESTFTVAALRTAGIPARQVYTPRWAHCDDNHAWVEFWSNGRWYYMGACEPEAVPDRGWFTEPAKRAMLVNTRSIGAQYGNENIISAHGRYSMVNNLSKYAPVKRIFVCVKDSNDKPVNAATVEYQLYNYSEFYPLATTLTDSRGFSSFETGFGDLIVWARNGDEFDFRKISVGSTDTLNLRLLKRNMSGTSMDLDLSVPVKTEPGQPLAAELVSENDRRVTEENSIRKSYIQSWPGHVQLIQFAIAHNLDTAKTVFLLTRSQGNFREIMAFLGSIPDSLKPEAITLLEKIAEKDLRDTKEDVLKDHLLNCTSRLEKDDPALYSDYLLNPRISDEILTPWRSGLIKYIPDSLMKSAEKDPSLLIGFLNRKLRIADEFNYSRTPVSPCGTLETGYSDTKSRAICFVALARTLGIPSRLEPGSNLPQYYFKQEWHDVYFADQLRKPSKRGFLTISSRDKNPVPLYYKNFTLARFEEGRYNTLEYDEDKPASEFRELSLIPGRYMLVTGNRINDSRILTSISFFDIAEGEHKSITVSLRHESRPPEILGKARLGSILTGLDDEFDKYKSMAGRKTLLFWLETDREPSKHVLNDLFRLEREISSKGCAFVFFTVGGTSLTPEEKNKLPYNSLYGDDSNHEVLKKQISCKGLDMDNFPVVLFVSPEDDIIYKSEGYHIGTVEELLKLL